MTFKHAALSVALIAFALPATADTLYNAGPPGQAPGHPMRLGADRRASQVGDLVPGTFNLSVTNTISNTSTKNNTYSLGIVPGTGLANLPLVRIGAGLSGGQNTTT